MFYPVVDTDAMRAREGLYALLYEAVTVSTDGTLHPFTNAPAGTVAALVTPITNGAMVTFEGTTASATAGHIMAASTNYWFALDQTELLKVHAIRLVGDSAWKITYFGLK